MSYGRVDFKSTLKLFRREHALFAPQERSNQEIEILQINITAREC